MVVGRMMIRPYDYGMIGVIIGDWVIRPCIGIIGIDDIYYAVDVIWHYDKFIQLGI